MELSHDLEAVLLVSDWVSLPVENATQAILYYLQELRAIKQAADALAAGELDWPTYSDHLYEAFHRVEGQVMLSVSARAEGRLDVSGWVREPWWLTGR